MSDARDWLPKARRAVQSAKLLANDGDFDTAVSRAYYAMFYAVESLLVQRGLEFSSHKEVISAFGREFAKKGILREFHRDLIEAAEARTAGDYLAQPSFDQPQAASLIIKAESFVDAIEKVIQAGHPSDG